ncbi:hypothetical protein ACVKXF_000827 [Curtobacterium sp. PvP017]
MDLNYLDRLGVQIRKQVPESDLPDEETSDLFRLYAVLLLAKGQNVSAEDVHNAWVAWMTARDPNHESLRPFGELSNDVAADDEPYLTAIRRVAGQSHG